MNADHVPTREEPDETRIVVLVVEDERAISSVVAEVVHDAGYLPVVARNGHEALERARRQWPGLVLTDLMMPHLDGAGMIRALRQEAATRGAAMPPVILMTAASPIHARAAGADALLRKPFDLNELDALLERFLG
jgi:DNA-binding response OmpR family regulator